MPPGWCGRSEVRGGQWVISTISLMPESVQWPKKTSWLSSQRWVPSFVDDEEIVVTIAAAMSSRWRRQECAVDNSKRAGGGRRRRRMQGQGGGNVYAWWAGGRQHDKRVCVCVCVCACPPVMRGGTVKHALTSTSSPPQ